MDFKITVIRESDGKVIETFNVNGYKMPHYTWKTRFGYEVGEEMYLVSGQDKYGIEYIYQDSDDDDNTRYTVLRNRTLAKTSLMPYTKLKAIAC